MQNIINVIFDYKTKKSILNAKLIELEVKLKKQQIWEDWYVLEIKQLESEFRDSIEYLNFQQLKREAEKDSQFAVEFRNLLNPKFSNRIAESNNKLQIMFLQNIIAIFKSGLIPTKSNSSIFQISY